MNLIWKRIIKYEICYWRIKNNLEIINDEIEIVSSTLTEYGISIYIEKEFENEYNEEIKKSILNFNWYDFKNLKKIIFYLNWMYIFFIWIIIIINFILLI